MYNRKIYLDKLKAWQDKPLIKILVGLRRAGKSTLIKLFINSLIEKKVEAQRVLYINKESLQYAYVQTYTDLYREVRNRYNKINQKLYLFVDEVQEIENWEKAIISIYTEELADIYISGSNARIFSGELATLLGGRYIPILVLPLTYNEFLLFRNQIKHDEKYFNEFLKYGGLPGIHHLQWKDEFIFEYIYAVYNTIVLRDIVQRNNLRNAAFLEKVIQFVFDNISQIFSAKRIVDFLKKEHRRTNIETVYNYIKFLEEAHVIFRVPRYDIKGKRLLEVREKYFVADLGLRHALLGYKERDINQLLENIVFIELLKRGYTIKIGQLGSQEIDFIIEKENKKAYLQVVYLLASKETIEREFGSLAKIKDNYPKYVLSLDRHFVSERDGIIHLNLIDFLLAEKLTL
ncbi:ATP-binding protein [Calditrichota bacterium LG25]